MSSTRLQPLREPQVFGTAPRRQSLVLGNLQTVRSPQSQRRSLGTHSNSPMQVTQILSPGSVTVRSPQSQRRSLGTHSNSPMQATRILSPGSPVSLTTPTPMPSATSVVGSSRSTPRLVQVPQLNLKAVSFQTERQQAEECRSQKAELVQMVEQRQEQEYVGLGAESLQAEMEEVQQIQEIERSEVENRWVAQKLEADRLRERELERAIEEAERVQIETKLLLAKAEADVERREAIERLQRERYLAEQQQEVNQIRQEEDEQEKEATRFQHESDQLLESEGMLSWQQQEAGCIRKEDKEAVSLEQEQEYLVSQSRQELQQHQQPAQHAHKKEEEQACHSDYDRVSHKVQEITGLEKELLVEDTDLQTFPANSDLTRMQRVAALLNYQVDALKLRVRDPKTQVMAASAAGGGFALGTAGAVTGAIVGGAVGAGAGLPAALFTFGWSIPISAVVGGGAGLGLGASAGGAVGAIGGGTVGLQVYNYRTRVAVLKDSPDVASPLDTTVAGA